MRQNWCTGRKRAHGGVILHRDVAGQRGAIGENSVAADDAIVRDVRTRHEQIVAADARDAAALHGAAAHRDDSRKTLPSPTSSAVRSPRISDPADRRRRSKRNGTHCRGQSAPGRAPRRADEARSPRPARRRRPPSRTRPRARREPVARVRKRRRGDRSRSTAVWLSS